MSKYHINKNGEPAVCKAQVKCPLGDEDAHYKTPDEARRAFEDSQSESLIKTHGVNSIKQEISAVERDKRIESLAKTLNKDVEFDSPFIITEDAELVADRYSDPDADLDGVYPPETMGEDILSNDWEWVDGYSGQQGYSGPVMHPSEYLGGGMARDVAATPGVYSLAVVECDHDGCYADPVDVANGTADCDPEGWGLLRRVDSDDSDANSFGISSDKNYTLLDPGTGTVLSDNCAIVDVSELSKDEDFNEDEFISNPERYVTDGNSVSIFKANLDSFDQPLLIELNTGASVEPGSIHFIENGKISEEMNESLLDGDPDAWDNALELET